MKQSQPLRVEDADVASFCTSRCVNSALWFVNNKRVEVRVLGYMAKYQEKYSVEIYGYVLTGNHGHLVAAFPNHNRGDFMRDLNARTAEGVRFYVTEFEGGHVFGRRYADQSLLASEDIEDKMLYCALQPVHHGLCQRISEYPGFNSFTDAVSGIVREYPVVDWAGYNKKRKYDPSIKVADYTTYHKLTFSRPEQYKQMDQKEYKELMLGKLEERRIKIIQEKLDQGFQYPSDLSYLKETIPGTRPHKTKTSKRHDKRPRIFGKDPVKLDAKKTERYNLYFAYKQASKAYLAGNEHVEFPPYTYKPPRFMVGPPKAA